MNIKTRLSKLEVAKFNPGTDKQQAEAIANTRVWLAEKLADVGRSKRQPNYF